MRTPLALALLVAAVAAVPASGAATRSIAVKDDVFSPKAATVAKGTTVVWRWQGDSPHNVVVTSGPVRFKSVVQRSGTFRRRLTRAGTYRYVCTIHAGMRGTIRVR
jgi:plastocyanin